MKELLLLYLLWVVASLYIYKILTVSCMWEVKQLLRRIMYYRSESHEYFHYGWGHYHSLYLFCQSVNAENTIRDLWNVCCSVNVLLSRRIWASLLCVLEGKKLSKPSALLRKRAKYVFFIICCLPFLWIPAGLLMVLYLANANVNLCIIKMLFEFSFALMPF